MPEKPTVALSEEGIANMIASAIEAARRPILDPQAEQAKRREKAQMRASIERMEQMKKARERACNHLREDGSAAIAWATQSDRVTRGVCQHCNRVITPQDADYVQLLRIPHKGSIGEACLAGR
jgi:vacuolar-type H+-ATPase subunit H